MSDDEKQVGPGSDAANDRIEGTLKEIAREKAEADGTADQDKNEADGAEEVSP